MAVRDLQPEGVRAVIGFLPLLVLAAIVAGVVAVVRRSHAARPGGGAPPGEFRRAAELTFLAVLCIVATVGVAGMLTRLFDAMAGVAVRDDVAATARALAFTLIAGPLAAAMWWWRWRRSGPQEQRTVVWALFLNAMTTLALVVWSIDALHTSSRWVSVRLDRAGLATAIAWGAAWLGYRWVQRRSSRRPDLLADVAPVLGSATGLGLAMFGAIAALGGLGTRALETASDVLSPGGAAWWRSVLGWALFAAGGAAVWWLHWVHDGARRLRSGLADAALVVSGIVAGAAVALVGAGMVLFDVTRRLAGADIDLASAEPGPATALALGLVGATVWAYHQRALADRSVVTQRSAGLALSGIGLVGAATGLGIVVNAALGAVGPTLSGSGTRDLLCGGLSMLSVGLPLWVVAWRPGVQIRDPEQRHWSGRQIYLVLVFGASALTALVTALVVGYQVFEYLLSTAAERGLLDRVRVSLGLLTATLVVAAYHFPVWRRDRTIRERHERDVGPSLRSVVLVTGAEADASHLDDLVRSIRESTGATVTVWTRADAGACPPTGEQLREAVAGVRSPRVLVITRADGTIEVVPLSD